jgi:prepilin-type N-terminal cleavage/methylation domain-containing protein
MNAQPPSSARSRPARAGAFTLIEILIVLGIVGLILTMGVPAFVKAVHKEGMRKAESDLLEACQKARAGAILKADGKPQELILRPFDGTFEAPGAFPLTALPADVSFQAISVNDMARDQDDVVVVRFFSRGTSDDFTVVIRNDKDGSLCTVWLDPVTALADLSTSK